MQSLKKSQSAFTKRNYKYVFTGCDLTKDFGEDGNFPRINYLIKTYESKHKQFYSNCMQEKEKQRVN